MTMPVVHCTAPDGAIHTNYDVTEAPQSCVMHDLPHSGLWHYLYGKMLDK